MLEGFGSGIFGGLFGHALGKWLGKFKYRTIFIATTILTQLLAIAMTFFYRGKTGLIYIFTNDKDCFMIIFLYFPLGAGLLISFITFISLSISNRNDS